MDCTAGTYNPLEGSDLGTACVPCPEFSTSPIASTSVDDCICQDGFVTTVVGTPEEVAAGNGTAMCECDAGKEIMASADGCVSSGSPSLPFQPRLLLLLLPPTVTLLLTGDPSRLSMHTEWREVRRLPAGDI